MSNGSEEGSVVIRTTLPGHVMLAGVDALTVQGFREWVGSIHPIFVETNLANRLVEDGYNHVSVANHVTEDMLRGDYDVKPGHAKVFVFADAALALHKRLGYGTSTTNALVTSTTPQTLMKRRTPTPKVPLASSSAGCGLAGLGTVAAI